MRRSVENMADYLVIRDGDGQPVKLMEFGRLEWPVGPSCFMCGATDGLLDLVPAVCGDRVACDERMAAWRPTGLVQPW